MIRSFKSMAEYLKKHGDLDVHPDTLRKAVTDGRNPLVVVWDNGTATIEPGALLRWRASRKGLLRRNRRAA